MRRTPALALAGMLLALVAGCGGGGDSDFEPIPELRGTYGSISVSYNDCGYIPIGVSTGYRSSRDAAAAAISECEAFSGTNCFIARNFGTAYFGNNDCGAIAIGRRSSQGRLRCTVTSGGANSVSEAESRALRECLADGRYDCHVPTVAGGRVGTCSR